MFIIYDLIFLVFVLIYLPIYLGKRKFHRGFLLRLGILPRNLKLDSPIWIHAVSVGEAMAIRGLVEEMRKKFSDKRFVISTVTPTGNKIVKSIARQTDYVTYLPLDFSFVVRVVLDKIKPCLFIIAETEIWPNLISYLYRKQIPMIVVNGRISDASFKGYLSIKFLLKPILNKINMFCVQTERDADRLIRLGVFSNKVKVTGNMKFDFQPQTLSFNAPYLKLKDREQLLVCGSTHPGEEEIILKVYRELLSEFPDLRLLIAPRHPERAKEVERLVLKNGFTPVFISDLQVTSHEPQVTTVFILDTVGQLLNFYAIADIVFVGGSLVKKGGQNILEPASFGKPVIFGPYMFNFRDIADLFLKNQAGIMARNPEELKVKIEYLLNHPQEMIKLGQQAEELIRKNRGATQKNLERISLVKRKEAR